MEEDAVTSISAAWRRRCGRRPLYADEAGFLELVQQVLSRDIRSVHQRHRGAAAAASGGAAAAGGAASGAPAACGGDAGGAGGDGARLGAGGQVGYYHVVLDNVDVSYDVDDAGCVHVRGGTPAARGAPQ